MQSYKYREQWGHTTATTLRLTEPYWGKKKILIADAWFGGLRCCYALLALGGIRSVMNVKVNSKGYPKKVMKEHAKKRGDTYSMKVKVEEEEIFASVHVDKAPMFLVHTAESMLQGPERKRNFLVYDKEKQQNVRCKYTLEQPQCHAVYRGNFWAVDRFNNLALGPTSIQYCVRTLDWRKRMFFALLAMSVTNAYLATVHCCKLESKTPPSHATFLEELAFELKDNVYQDTAAVVRSKGDDNAVRLAQILAHQGVTARADRKGRKCVVCQQFLDKDKQKKDPRLKHRPHY